ncbi:MAG: hypothetical protein JJ992_10495 [Planctomycetes bacterium]|nr:hypothetical protein [Planctomycetota bacterium]
MFGLFKSPCPIELREKVWTELRLGWLVERWGWQRLRESDVILPTGQFFELPEAGDTVDVERTFTDVCRYLGARRESLRLEVVPADDLADGSDEFVPGDIGVVRLAESWRDDLESLIAIMAHYAAQDRLLREGLCSGDESDLGWRADLACVFLGMGIFGANSAVKQRGGEDASIWWRNRVRRRLPARISGYTMALIAVSRRERHPAWSRWLVKDALDSFQRGLRFLHRHGECIFDYEANGALRVAGSVSSLASDLRHGGDSARLASLWALHEHGSAAPAAMEEILGCLRSRSTVLQGEAARLIGSIGADSADVADELMSLLSSRDRQVRCSAITALSQLQVPLDCEGPHGCTLFDELGMLLGDEDTQVAQTTVLALCQYGTAASEAALRLLEPLRRALVDCDYLAQDLCFTALGLIHGDVDGFLEEHLQEHHPDLYPVAITALQQSREHHRSESP